MILAIDLGATNTRSALVSKDKLKEKREVKTAKKKSEIISNLFNLINSYKNFSSICISIAGFEKLGLIAGTRNMDLSGTPLRKMLKKKYSVPVYIENDANCAGLTELIYGAGKGKVNFILLTLGTGIGGAVITDGKLYRGQGAAGEVGRLLLNNTPYEELASGTASVSLAHKNPKLKNVTSIQLESLAKNNNKSALEVYKEVGHYLGLGMLDLSYVLDPEIIILGGGFSRVKYIYAEAKSVLSKKDELHRKIPIVHAKYGDDAGMIGAATLARE